MTVVMSHRAGDKGLAVTDLNKYDPQSQADTEVMSVRILDGKDDE